MIRKSGDLPVTKQIIRKIQFQKVLFPLCTEEQWYTNLNLVCSLPNIAIVSENQWGFGTIEYKKPSVMILEIRTVPNGQQKMAKWPTC